MTGTYDDTHPIIKRPKLMAMLLEAIVGYAEREADDNGFSEIILQSEQVKGLRLAANILHELDRILDEASTEHSGQELALLKFGPITPFGPDRYALVCTGCNHAVGRFERFDQEV